MPESNAEKELHRIEQELNAKAEPPASESRVAKINRSQPHLDAVLVGAVLLAAIGFITVVGESLSPKQKTQLSSGAIGGAVGLLVGYGIGRIKRH